MTLLRANSELRKDRIWNFTIPAFWVRREGKVFKTCPNAGACATVCYARNGTFNFSNVKAAHTRNLDLVLDSPEGFVAQVNEELRHKRFRPTGSARQYDFSIENDYARLWARNGGAAVRIHDSGDFFSQEYLDLWKSIAEANPQVLFYAYTKEVEMFKKNDFPANFLYLFSTGGLQDDLIDMDNDRHADVFPSAESMRSAGYTDQEKSDLYAVLLPTNKIGIVANNIPHFNKKIDGRRFSEL